MITLLQFKTKIFLHKPIFLGFPKLASAQAIKYCQFLECHPVEQPSPMILLEKNQAYIMKVIILEGIFQSVYFCIRIEACISSKSVSFQMYITNYQHET